MNWKDILKVMAPAVMAVVPGAAPFIPLVVAGMTVAEESQQPGANKKTIAKQATKLGAEAVNLASKGKVHLEPAEAEQIADDVIDAVVGVTNLVAKLTPDTNPMMPVPPQP